MPTEPQKIIRRFNYVGDDAEMVEEPDGAYVLFAELGEQVRDVLDGLTTEVGDCWCIHFGSQHHTEECEQAQQLFKQFDEK